MKFVAYLFFALVLLVVGRDISESNPSQSDRPNILFLVIDDLNDWTAFLGGHPDAITPNMDRLAEKGVSFTNAYCSAPGCSPSRNAVIFGIEPFNSGLYAFYDKDIHELLMTKYTSLPKLLKENGYNTYSAGKIHHGNSNDHKEWSGFYKINRNFRRKFNDAKGYHPEKMKMFSFRPTTYDEELHIDHQIANYGIDILKQKHKDPFFLALGLIKPHLPFDAPERFFDSLPDTVAVPEINRTDFDDIPAEGRSFIKERYNKIFSKDGGWHKVRKAYLACISWADYNLGRVLDELENSEYANNTIVVLWSDHGYHLEEKLTFRKFTLWEEATKVPFIIYDPRTKKAREHQPPVSLINIYKTIADYAGVESPNYVDGKSLRPVIENVDVNFDEPVYSTWGNGNIAIRKGDWRYIRYFDQKEELYNRKNDPNEWLNLANNPNFARKKQSLKKMLPNKEAATVYDFVQPWSLVGSDRIKAKEFAK